MKIIRFGVFLVCFGFMITSCSKSGTGGASLYNPTQSDVTTNATLDQLQQGRDLYIQNCNTCHQLYSPDAFTAGTWPSIIAQMASRTSMTSAQVSLVKKYLTRGK